MNSEYKMTLTPKSLDNADPKALALLEKAKAQLGFVPNMFGGMAHSPGLLATYMDGYDRFRQDSTFTPAEQEVVFLTVSIGNGCDYCVAAHSMIADKMSKVPAPVLGAIRDGSAIPDEKLAALSTFTSVMGSSRGLPSNADVRSFLSAGYSEPQILEVVLAIAVKTLSNYSNHLFHTPVDEMFVGYALSKNESVDRHSAPAAAVADFD